MQCSDNILKNPGYNNKIQFLLEGLHLENLGKSYYINIKYIILKYIYKYKKIEGEGPDRT